MHPHNERLQSLRGMAALMVMFGHASLLVPMALNRAFLTEVMSIPIPSGERGWAYV